MTEALSRPGVRIAGFAVGLAAVFGLLFGIGRAVGPWDSDPAPAHAPAVQDNSGQHGEGHR